MSRAPSFLLSALLLLACGESSPELDSLERMAREHAGDAPVASPAASAEPQSEVVAREAVYGELEGEPVRGWVAHPAAEGDYPGIIVIQEWWGLNDNIRAMTERLAGEGYLALAVDLYEGEVAEDRETAMTLVRRAGAQPQRLEENLSQARAHLAAAGASRVGVVGWCFGGGWSLRTALLLGPEIDAAVIYYGRPVTERDQLARLRAPLLGHFGALDDGIPVDRVRELEAALAALGKEATIYIYEGADHAFANPSGTRYHEAAAELAWERTLDFFDRHLRGPS